MKLPTLAFHPIDSTLIPSDPSTLPRARRRLMDILLKGSPTPIAPPPPKSWSLDFCLTPKAFLPSPSTPSRLATAEFEQTSLSSPFDPNAYALGTGKTTQITCSVAFRSIGYKSTPLPEFADLGIPFDDGRGVISNDRHGRVQHEERARDGLSVLGSFPGLYCAGWVKRGPTGVIASTMQDAFDTADAMAGDWAEQVPFLNAGREVDGWEGVKAEQGVEGAKVVSWEDWRRIDGAERERGRPVGKEREKFTKTAEMLAVLG